DSGGGVEDLDLAQTAFDAAAVVDDAHAGGLDGIEERLVEADHDAHVVLRDTDLKGFGLEPAGVSKSLKAQRRRLAAVLVPTAADLLHEADGAAQDRKSTRLNSSHV